MGAFSKALKDAQYLKPFADSLSEYKQRLDEQKGREALIQLMDKINTEQNRLFTDRPEVTAPANDFEVKPQIGGTFSKLAPQLTETEGGVPYTAPQRPQILQPGQTQDPGFNIVENKYSPTTNPNDYRQAVNERNKLFSNILSQYALDKNVKPEQLNQVLQIAQLGVPSAPYIPKKDTKQLGDYAFTFDEYGNQIGAPLHTKKDAGGWRYDRDKSGNPVIYNYEGQNYFRKEKPNGEENYERVPQTGEGKTSVNITNQGLDEGMRKIRIAQTEADLRSWLNTYSKHDKLHKEATDDFGKKKQQDEKSRILANEIKPRVKEITSLVAQEFPSFVGTMERYLGDTRIHKDPKLIESEILPEMKEAGIPERMRYLVRDLLKAQIFSSETLPNY